MLLQLLVNKSKPAPYLLKQRSLGTGLEKLSIVPGNAAIEIE
jgi:hypothetical protein